MRRRVLRRRTVKHSHSGSKASACGNVQAPVGGGGFGGVAKGHLVGGAGLAEGDNLVNVGRGGEAEGLDDFVQTRQRRLEVLVPCPVLR